MRKTVSSFALLVLLLVLAMAPALRAAEPPALAGHWTGAIELPGQKLDFDLDFAFANGAWTGDVTIPLQNARNLPLEAIALDAGVPDGVEAHEIPGLGFRKILLRYRHGKRPNPATLAAVEFLQVLTAPGDTHAPHGQHA